MENKSMVRSKALFEQNKRRMVYHIHKLNGESLYLLLHTYKNYQPYRGILSTYFNFTIRNLLIDLRNEKRQYPNFIRQNLKALHLKVEREQDPLLWEMLQAELNEKQWHMMDGDIRKSVSRKEITGLEKNPIPMGKGWARPVGMKWSNVKY